MSLSNMTMSLMDLGVNFHEASRAVQRLIEVLEASRPRHGHAFSRKVHRSLVRNGRILKSAYVDYRLPLQNLPIIGGPFTLDLPDEMELVLVRVPVTPYRKRPSPRAMRRRLVNSSMKLLHTLDDLAGEERLP